MMPAVQTLLVGKVNLLHYPNTGKEIAVKRYSSLFINANKINTLTYFGILAHNTVSKFTGLCSDEVRTGKQALVKRLLAISSFSINQ